MRKIYEHNDKAIKSFIIGDHQIHLLESSKKGLLISITNNTNDDTTSLFIANREVNKLIRVIYERLTLIRKELYVYTIKNVRILHCNDGEVIYDRHGDIDIIPTQSSFQSPGVAVIKIYVKKFTVCQEIKIKSFNDILTVEHI